MVDFKTYHKMKASLKKPLLGLVALDGIRILWKLLGIGKFILLLIGILIGLIIGLGRK